MDVFPEYDYSEKEKAIEIKIRKITQLFNSFDPSPFIEKDLDDDAFEYIVSSVAEHSIKARQKIIINLPINQKSKISELEIRKSIQNYFEYKKSLMEKNIKHKFEEGETTFGIGIVFLAVCLIFARYFQSIDSIWASIVSEGLIIGGWVAMWKPISTVLYDWRPLLKEKKIYEKIAKMGIEFKYIDDISNKKY